MSLHQEFHEHLQAGRLTEAISLVVGQLVELKITTRANSGRLHTTIDLLNGQITNTVDPAFFSDKASQKLLEFHSNQITATSQVVREQLRSLQDLLQALTPPEAAPENIKLVAIAASESDVLLNLAKPAITASASEAIDQVNDPVNSLVAAPPLIMSTPTSETLPVALPDVVPEISTPALTEKSAEIFVPDQPISPLEPPSTKGASETIKEDLPISQPESLVAKTPERSSSPEPLVAKTVEQLAIAQPEVNKDADYLKISEPENDFGITAADLAALSAQTTEAPAIKSIVSEPARSLSKQTSEPPERVKLPEVTPVAKPESRAGIASGLAAALAQTSALDPAEAATIPNKFDQALRSAGVRSTAEEELHPFAAQPPVAEQVITQPVIEQPTELIPKRELIDLLRESEDDWDEWLLEEDHILSELSDVTRDKIPDLESQWLSATTGSSVTAKSSPSDWEEFMPEYPEINSVAGKNQANVERFRQNLVNDPQLMSELLAELDDLEEMEEGKPKN